MATLPYSRCVFINCPFDKEYEPLRNTLVFVIYDCGFVPRCALEINNSGEVRIEKIRRLIRECKYGIHDISRTEIDQASRLPRFNMPLELGVFLGAKLYGDRKQRDKNCLILDSEQYRYQKFISDIAGHDIKSHGNRETTLVREVRSWLSDCSRDSRIPGGRVIEQRMARFRAELPRLCGEADLTEDEMTYNDYSTFASEWLIETS